MIRNNRLRAATLGFGLALLSTSLLAAPVVTVVSNADAGTTLPSDVAEARGTFAGQFDASTQESFSNAPTGALVEGSGNETLPVFSGNGLLTPTFGLGTTYNVRSSGSSGRFDTTCLADPANCTPKWFEASGSFALSFGGAFNGFGFYGTDIGDFYGYLQIELIGSDGQRTLLDQVAFPDRLLDGGALFYGVFDSMATYTGANVYITQRDESGGIDFFGFDDLILGRVNDDPNPNPVPEPGSLALVGASLLALTAARRRRGRQA